MYIHVFTLGLHFMTAKPDYKRKMYDDKGTEDRDSSRIFFTASYIARTRSDPQHQLHFIVNIAIYIIIQL